MIIFEYPEPGMSEERKQAHRIERLLQEEIKLLQRIAANFPEPTFPLATGATMAFAPSAANQR